MTDDQVRTALLPAFPAGFTLIVANENGPRPPGMYGTVRVENSRRLPSHNDQTETPDPIPALGQRGNDAHRTGRVEVQVFGTGAYDALDTAIQRLDTEAAMDAAEAVSMVFGRTQDLQSVPVLRNASQFEERAVASFPFAYTRRVVEQIPVFETIEGEALVNDLPPLPFSVDN